MKYLFAGLLRPLSFLVLVLLLACANPIPPAGGEKDEIPPQVVTDKSTPNFQTNFRPQRIELTFDEWVKVQDAFTEIIASPPLDYEIKLRGKTLQLNIAEDENLRENATYVINFGQAIRDLTEGNPADELRFVFSTGPTIDSLELSGRVIDAYSGEAIPDVLFMLYENSADSVVRTEKPFYFARTNEQGVFRVSNVRPGLFKGFALEDADRNYLFNQPSERIGFPDSLIRASRDTSSQYTIRLFTPAAPPRIASVDSSRYGRLVVGFNQSPVGINTDISGSTRSPFQEMDQDSLRIFFAPDPPQSVRIILQQDTLLNDTILVSSSVARLRTDSLRLRLPAQRTGIRQNPTLPLTMVFSHPIARYDSSRILLLQDTLPAPLPFSIRIDTSRARQILVQKNWQEGKNHRLLLLPNSIEDWYGRSNRDTIQLNFLVESRKSFGNYRLSFTDAEPDRQYVIKLFNKQNALQAEYILRGERTYVRTQNALPPGDYRLEIIYDVNQNGRWDPGNYDRKRQAEAVVIRPLESLRANWDVEVSVSLNQ